jgi:tetratricopeptide (TPR) repeat protein
MRTSENPPLNTLLIMMRGLSSMLLLCVTCVSAVGALAEDVVYLTPEGQDHGRVGVRGEIVDYTGEAITIAQPTGEPRRYPAARVAKIETPWNDAYVAGRAALAKGDIQTAARQLAEANRTEQRVWARRLILADLMRAYASLGQPEQAGDLLVALAQSDPATPAWDDAPLAWFPDDRVSRAKAESWLATRDQPAAVLLGASYLLSTSEATEARQALFELVKHPDPRIATLAEALLWRSALLRANADDAARWAARIEQMPEPLRAGPYYLLGQAYDRLGLPDDAALAYLHLPVLYPARRELAARALVDAGRLMSRSGSPDEAAQLWNEVLTNYPDTPQRAEAEQLLKKN